MGKREEHAQRIKEQIVKETKKQLQLNELKSGYYTFRDGVNLT